MAIAKPTNLTVAVNAQISSDVGAGRVSITPIASENIILNFQSYATGSISLTSLSGEVVLGKYGLCFINADAPILVSTSDNSGTSSHITKMFALNGDNTEVAISTTSVIPVTVSYVLGSV